MQQPGGMNDSEENMGKQQPSSTSSPLSLRQQLDRIEQATAPVLKLYNDRKTEQDSLLFAIHQLWDLFETAQPERTQFEFKISVLGLTETALCQLEDEKRKLESQKRSHMLRRLQSNLLRLADGMSSFKSLVDLRSLYCDLPHLPELQSQAELVCRDPDQQLASDEGYRSAEKCFQLLKEALVVVDRHLEQLSPIRTALEKVDSVKSQLDEVKKSISENNKGARKLNKSSFSLMELTKKEATLKKKLILVTAALDDALSLWKERHPDRPIQWKPSTTPASASSSSQEKPLIGSHPAQKIPPQKASKPAIISKKTVPSAKTPSSSARSTPVKTVATAPFVFADCGEEGEGGKFSVFQDEPQKTTSLPFDLILNSGTVKQTKSSFKTPSKENSSNGSSAQRKRSESAPITPSKTPSDLCNRKKPSDSAHTTERISAEKLRKPLSFAEDGSAILSN